MPSGSERCSRCGQDWWWRWRYDGNANCVHTIGCKVVDMSDEEAERVRARYAFGKLHNPDHDNASYRDKAQPGQIIKVENPNDHQDQH